jgi:hypothetical protein
VPERWTRPPLVPREPPPAWAATWRFRLVALLLLALLVAGAVQLFRVLSGATAQDPGIDAAPTAPRLPPDASLTEALGSALGHRQDEDRPRAR